MAKIEEFRLREGTVLPSGDPLPYFLGTVLVLPAAPSEGEVIIS